MDTHRRLVRRLFSAPALPALLLAALVLAPLVPTPRIALAQGGIVGSVTSEPYGTFGGIAYVKHSGRFDGLASGEYDVPFEIIAPADPTEGNGIVIVEPFHIVGGRPGGNAYLTPEFVFDQGFSYAGVGWHPEGANPLQGYSVEEAVEILHNFTVALKEDPAAVALVGTVQKLYAVGVSMTTQPLLTLLDSPGGDGQAGVVDRFVQELPGEQDRPVFEHEVPVLASVAYVM